MKRAVSMPCTEEQWLNEVKPLCDKYGVSYYMGKNAYKNPHIINNLDGINNAISILDSNCVTEHNRTLIPYNPIEFIKACGVEVEEPKWEKLTRGGYEYHIYEEFDGKLFGRIKMDGYWVPYILNPNGRANFNLKDLSSIDLIPYNPRKAELLTKKAELEKKLEEINKELNQ